MSRLFSIQRTAWTCERYLPGHEELLGELLRSVARSLERLLPPEAASRLDREGSTLGRQADGRLVVVRHPLLEQARRELAGLDLFRIFLAQEHGGLGLPVGLYYLTVQLVAYYDASLALVFLVHGNAMYALQRYGSAAQQRRYLPRLAAGELLASVAFSEAQAGSDAGAIRTRATAVPGGYRLEGSKLWITHGGDADLLVTTARTGPLAEGIDGVSTFLVERQADGVELVGLEDKTGLAGSPTAELRLPGILVPAERLLGAEGQGGQVMFAGVGMTRVNIGAQALGIGKRAFDAAVDFARQREQGGGPILGHDAVQQRLADMALTLSAMENLIARVAALEERGVWHVREMSLTKYFCSEALQELTARAINVFGGYGVSRHYPVERCRREAVALPLFGGTSEIQWFIISRELLAAAAGQGRADYRARDREDTAALGARCAGALSLLLAGVAAGEAALWSAVEKLAAASDPAPYYRQLAELDVALAVARALLWQAADPRAGALERELAQVAVERLEDRVQHCQRRLARLADRQALKQALLAELAD